MGLASTCLAVKCGEKRHVTCWGPRLKNVLPKLKMLILIEGLYSLDHLPAWEIPVAVNGTLSCRSIWLMWINRPRTAIVTDQHENCWVSNCFLHWHLGNESSPFSHRQWRSSWISVLSQWESVPCLCFPLLVILPSRAHAFWVATSYPRGMGEQPAAVPANPGYPSAEY